MTTRVYQIAVEVLRPSSAIQHDATVTDSVATTDSATVTWNLGAEVTETAAFTDPVARWLTDDLRDITDTVATTDSAGVGWNLGTTTTDALAFTETVEGILPILATGTSTVELAVEFAFAYGRTVTDTAAHTAAATQILRARPVITETLRVPSTWTPTTFYKFTQTEALQLLSLTNAGFPRTIAETLAFTDSAAVRLGLVIADRLGLVDVTTPLSKYRVSALETVLLLDSLGKFFAGDVIESLALADPASRVLRTPQTAAETVAWTDSTAPKLVLRVQLNDAWNLTDAQVLKMILTPTVQEYISVAAAYIDPGNSVTTWAVNLRTGATTEYTNYEFNSFADFGRKYLGATRTGLYELAGDDDAGTDIIAKLKSGILQFFNANHTHLYGVYMASRGDGDYLLRVETKDGTRTYSVKTESMKTARTHVGKGVRARYFAFELESTGQDFDLEHIRFVPVIARRRS